MGDFEINSVSWNLSIDELYNLAYHIGFNKPVYPTSPEHNLMFREDLTKLLDKLNIILDIDTIQESIERKWILPKIVDGVSMCKGCVYDKTGDGEFPSCRVRKTIKKCLYYTKKE